MLFLHLKVETYGTQLIIIKQETKQCLIAHGHSIGI